MKFLSMILSFALGQDTEHDPEAMAFCSGKQNGFYDNPNDCNSYFHCWNNGETFIVLSEGIAL